MRLPPLTSGHIVCRYKRFLADVELTDGRSVTAHCPNTGSMSSCWEPGAAAQVSYSANPKRKLPWTLERIDMGRGWVGVHTGRTNAVVAEGIVHGRVPQLTGYRRMQREPVFNIARYPPARFDLLLSKGIGPDAFVEVKNTTLLDGDVVRFPDAVTVRGRKHLKLLVEAVRLGYRGVIVFAVNRAEGSAFAPAWDIDPEYAATLEWAATQGVEVLAARLQHDDGGIELVGTASW